MALVPCPACNKQVSEKAPNCPNCGHPIADRLVEVTPHKTETRSGSSRVQSPPASGSPVTNDPLPTMAKLICVYCLVASPILWILSNLTCMLGLSESENDPYFGVQLAWDFVDAVVGLAITLLLVWGGFSLRNLKPTARSLLLTGFGIKIGWVILSFIIGIALAIASIANDDEPSKPLSVVDMLSLFMFAVFLVELVFVIISFVWLICNTLPTTSQALPRDEYESNRRSEKQRNSLSASTNTKHGISWGFIFILLLFGARIAAKSFHAHIKSPIQTNNVRKTIPKP